MAPKAKAAATGSPGKSSSLARAGASLISADPKAAAKPTATAAASKAEIAAPTSAKATVKPAAKAAAKAKAVRSADEEAKLKAEEEAETKAEEDAKGKAKAEAQAKEESDRKRKEESEKEIKRLQALANGDVTIKYSMYAEKFLIEGHTLTAKAIDDVYCLSDVMPGCFIHLANHEFAHGEHHSYVKEDPIGTFKGLMADGTYWCYVQQDAEQEKADLEKIRKQFAGGVASGLGDRGSEVETCSCQWGAPCTNSMVCKDWDNRYANAIKGGGNPILFT